MARKMSRDEKEEEPETASWLRFRTKCLSAFKPHRLRANRRRSGNYAPRSHSAFARPRIRQNYSSRRLGRLDRRRRRRHFRRRRRRRLPFPLLFHSPEIFPLPLFLLLFLPHSPSLDACHLPFRSPAKSLSGGFHCAASPRAALVPREPDFLPQPPAEASSGARHRTGPESAGRGSGRAPPRQRLFREFLVLGLPSRLPTRSEGELELAKDYGSKLQRLSRECASPVRLSCSKKGPPRFERAGGGGDWIYTTRTKLNNITCVCVCVCKIHIYKHM